MDKTKKSIKGKSQLQTIQNYNYIKFKTEEINLLRLDTRVIQLKKK